MRDQASPAAIRVLIADDHSIVREGLRQVLSRDHGFDVVGEATNGAEAADMTERLAPDVVVLDLSMPVRSGLEAARDIRDRAPQSRVLVLSIHDHAEYVLQSVRAGAQGYLRKDSTPAELRDAVRLLHAGGTCFSDPIARALEAAGHQARKLAELTPRERGILVEIARGATNKEMAGRFEISVRTVEAHRDAMCRKLGIRGAASLTRFAIDAGLLGDGVRT